MKILAVMGCSKFGNTTEVAKYFLQKLSEEMEFEQEFLYLADSKIEYCVGCHNCILLGEKKCPHYYNVSQIEKKMMEADIVILASPGYMFSVTGVMKTFLDHVAYNCHRPKYFEKKLVLLGNFTKWQKDSVFAPMETWASGAGFQICGKLWTDMMPFPLNEKALEKKKGKLDKGIKKIVKKIKNNRRRKLAFGDVAVFHVFRTLCQIAPNILAADHDYFKEKNAFEKSTKWYIPVKVPVLYTLVGRLMEKVVKKQVIRTTDMEKLVSIKSRYVIRLLERK